MDTRIAEVVKMVSEAYIKVYGEDKWISLTDKEKHDVIMTIVKDVVSRI